MKNAIRTATLYLSFIYMIVLIGVSTELPGAAGSLKRVIGLPTILLWGLAIWTGHKVRKPHSFHGLFLLFIIWNGLSYFWSVDPLSTVLATYKYFLVFGMSLLIWDLYRTEKDLELGLQAFIIGGLLVMLDTIYNYKTGQQTVGYPGRYSGFGFNPNEIGKIAAMSIPMAWYLGALKTDKRWYWRVFNVLYPLIALAAVVFSASRGGLIACVPAVIYVFSTINLLPKAGKYTFTALIAIGVAGLSRLDLSVQLARISTLYTTLTKDSGNLKHHDMNGRLTIWKAAISQFLNHPILGVGSGGFPRANIDTNVYYKDLPAHNTFLSICAELGLVGIIIFLVTMVVVARQIKTFPSIPRRLWWTIFICWLISASSSAFEVFPHTWVLFILIVAAANVTELSPVYVKNAINTRLNQLRRPVSIPKMSS